MSFTMLAVISLAALLGPLLALPRQWHLPVVLGELTAGVLLGPTAIGYLHAGDRTFTFLADIGFALIMFVAGARVPVRDTRLRAGLRIGALRALAVGLVAVVPAFALARAFGTGHTALYTVLMASSSAALVLPIIDSLALGGRQVIELLPQVAVADTACIVALPLVIDPGHAARADARRARGDRLRGRAVPGAERPGEARAYRHAAAPSLGEAALRPGAADQPDRSSSRSPRWRSAPTSRSCSRASPSDWWRRPSANRAAWRSSCSP